MKIGWNLGNTLDAMSFQALQEGNQDPLVHESAWFNPVTTEENLKTVINTGFNAIRIPVTWGPHLDRETFKINEAWLARVREVVDYAYNNGAYVVLNLHHEGFWLNTYEENYEKASKQFVSLWNQIADAFEGYDEHLIFEDMNEVRYNRSDIEWIGDDKGYEIINRLNELFVRCMRERNDRNKYRLLAITTYCGATRVPVVRNYSVPLGIDGEKDEKLFIAVHCYDPEPFALFGDGTGVWTETPENTFPIDDFFDRINTYLGPFDTPVLLDEFAALKKSNPENDESRVAWTKHFVQSARKNNVILFWWDNGNLNPDHDSMGLLDRRTNTWKWPDIVDAMVK